MEKKTLNRVLWRSFFLQASWNYQGHQSLGYASSVLPALEEIHGSDTGELKEAVDRNLSVFNTQPHISGPIIGALVRAEEIGEKGGFTSERLGRFRLAMTTAFAAIGDAFFWNAIIPAAAIIGLFWSLLGSWVGALIFFLLFNVVHYAIRVKGFYNGYAYGLDVARSLDRWHLPVLSLRLRLLNAGCLGGLAAWVLDCVTGAYPWWQALAVGFAGGCGVVLMSILLKRRLPVEVLVYAVLAVLILWFAVMGG